jgi:hypothetical protein
MRPEPVRHLDYAPPTQRASGFVTASLGFLVFVLHCIIQFILYRERVISRWSLADSDATVFLMPNLLALAAYAFLLGRWAAAKDWPVATKVAASIVLTLIIMFFSFWGSMLIPINMYGT